MTRPPVASAGLALAVILSLLALWHGTKPRPDEWVRHAFRAGTVEHRLFHPIGSVDCPLCWPGANDVDPGSPNHWKHQ